MRRIGRNPNREELGDAAWIYRFKGTF